MPVPTQQHSRWHYPSHHNPRKVIVAAHQHILRRFTGQLGYRDLKTHTSTLQYAAHRRGTAAGSRRQQGASMDSLSQLLQAHHRKIRIGFPFSGSAVPHRADRLVVKHRLLAGPQMDQAPLHRIPAAFEHSPHKNCPQSRCSPAPPAYQSCSCLGFSWSWAWTS